MPTGTKGDYEVGYGKPPRGAGFKKGQQPARPAARCEKPDDLAERRTERAGDDHRERPAPQDHQARGGDQAAGQQIRVRRCAFIEDPARSDAEPRGAGALFCRPAPCRRPRRRGGLGAAEGEARRRDPRSDRRREMTPMAYRHPEAPPADIPVVVPWAFSPRTSSVGKARTHRAATPVFSSSGNALPTLEWSCRGKIDPGFRRGDPRMPTLHWLSCP